MTTTNNENITEIQGVNQESQEMNTEARRIPTEDQAPSIANHAPVQEVKSSTMVLQIGAKTCALNFGISFVYEMNQRYCVSGNGVKLGAGIGNSIYYLDNYDPTVLVDIIEAATLRSAVQPNKVEIESWLETQDIEQVCKDFLYTLENAPMTKSAVAKVRENARAAQSQN